MHRWHVLCYYQFVKFGLEQTFEKFERTQNNVKKGAFHHWNDNFQWNIWFTSFVFAHASVFRYIPWIMWQEPKVETRTYVIFLQLNYLLCRNFVSSFLNFFTVRLWKQFSSVAGNIHTENIEEQIGLLIMNQLQSKLPFREQFPSLL